MNHQVSSSRLVVFDQAINMELPANEDQAANPISVIPIAAADRQLSEVGANNKIELDDLSLTSDLLKSELGEELPQPTPVVPQPGAPPLPPPQELPGQTSPPE